MQMTLVDTWASTAAGAFALSENSLYTVEAFREYFEHLKPGGMVAITRWEFRQPREALRVVSVAMQALHELGVRDPSRNFIVVSEGKLDEDGIPVVVLAKKSAFSGEEEESVRAHLSSNPGLMALYLPSARKQNPFSALIARNDPYAFAKQYPYDVAPVRDDAPFFFFNLKIGQVLHNDDLGQGIDWKVNLGVAVLAMVLVISCLAVVAFLVLPLALRGGRTQQRPIQLLYFVAVGLGYILVEIAFIQRFVLFLGHPTYALTVVVFLLLLSSGAGSLASRKWVAHPKHAWLPLAFIVGTLLLYIFVLPGLLNVLVGLPFNAKLLISAVLLVPLGICHGNAFPHGVGRTGKRSCPRVSRNQRIPGKCSRMGMGRERRFERARVRAGHGDCHSVRLERRSGMWGSGIFSRHLVRPHSTAASCLAVVLGRHPQSQAGTVSRCANVATRCKLIAHARIARYCQLH